MRNIFIITILIFTIVLIGGCAQNANNLGQNSMTHKIEQKFIILDSVNNPSMELRDVEYMQSNGEPQFIPNAKKSDPIIITKMPLTEINE